MKSIHFDLQRLVFTAMCNHIEVVPVHFMMELLDFDWKLAQFMSKTAGFGPEFWLSKPSVLRTSLRRGLIRTAAHSLDRRNKSRACACNAR